MIRTCACFIGMLLLAPGQKTARVVLTDGPGYTAEGQLRFPEKYREWVFLTSGLDMSYQSDAMQMDHSTFNNIFVNQSAYKSFQATGTWPEGTMLVLENRKGEGAKSINKAGKTQAELTGLEVHVKDSVHGGWGFYSFDNPKTAELIPKTATCYSCHEQHAAVDTTFVQFYPTLQEAAEKNKTWSKTYLAESGAGK